MAELVIGATYQARRNGPISVKMSESRALMVYIPYSLCDVEYSGVQSVCIGTRDGAKQEIALENLAEIFKWKTKNPFDLQRIPLPENNEAEFQLADWHNEPYTPKGKQEQVDSYKFRWLNKLSAGIKPATEDEEAAAMEVWGAKFELSTTATKAATKSAAKETPKAEEKPAAAKTPARKLPTAKKEPRKETAETVLALLCKKHGKDVNNQDDTNELGEKYYFPAQDELFGEGVSAETPEQWGDVANKLGL